MHKNGLPTLLKTLSEIISFTFQEYRESIFKKNMKKKCSLELNLQLSFKYYFPQ